MAAMILIICFGVYSYQNYKKELIEKEEKQLLTMAETIGVSLVNTIELELDSIDLYFTALESDEQAAADSFVTVAADTYRENKGSLYDAVACFDGEGKLIFQQGSMDVDDQRIPESYHAVITGKKIQTDGWYQMFVSKRVAWKKKQYTVVFAMNLNDIYQRIVEPVRIGDGGYSVVKDRNQAIIMHHAKDQIGMDAYEGRSKRYPQLDLTNLYNWVWRQQNEPEGYDMIHSYVWDDPELSPVQRIVAYTTIELPGEKWIVNSTLPFEELQGPLQLMLVRLCGMCIVLIGMLSAFFTLMARNILRAENQKKEIAYLKEINKGMELLRHKEEEIQHYQRVQSIGEMSSHIAHEFNNYLTPVMVYGELLEHDQSISPENQNMVREIVKSANQAANLSRKLLDFSRADSPAALTTINLTQEIREAAKVICQLAPRNISVQVELPREDCQVWGRSGMVEHILMNLCNNAFHAMEQGGGTLTIRLADSTGPNREGSWFCLTVRDTGCGISKDAMGQIFEPFYTTKRSGKGTGLGLSVIHNIMTVVGGEIRVESEVGSGTCFFLYFPAQQVQAVDAETKQTARRKKGKQRIVIVDDDQAMLDSVGALFRSAGYQVECYDHPAVVISKIQNKKDYCDILLTDYAMPSMNGMELAELIRKLNPGIFLLLMSGQEDARFEWYLKNRIIDDFILKTEIKACIMKQLQTDYKTDRRTEDGHKYSEKDTDGTTGSRE
ncbi:MAG: ATP-binding protein [Lachnospiraceae bacterium]|nr:ATP-binding protein [Lachnospiraceae bacterium]